MIKSYDAIMLLILFGFFCFRTTNKNCKLFPNNERTNEQFITSFLLKVHYVSKTYEYYRKKEHQCAKRQNMDASTEKKII